jgi:golgin subfamily B member 1
MAEVAATESERLALRRRLAARLEERGQIDDSIRALSSVLEASPEDVESHRSLTRLLRRRERHADLASELRRRFDLTTDPAERQELLRSLAGLYESQLADTPRAIETYERLAAAGDGAALAALARLHERAGNPARAADAALRRAEVETDPAARVELLALAGRMAELLGEAGAAEARYTAALEIDPAHLPSRTALVDLFRRRGDHLRAARMLREAAAHSAVSSQKARLLYEAGCLHADEMHNVAEAQALFAAVLELDPEHVEAATRLCTPYERAGQWGRLEPVLELLARKATEPAKRLQLYLRLAATSRGLDHVDKARRAYLAVLEDDATMREAQAGLADLLYDRAVKGPAREASALREDATQAVANYRSLLIHHGDVLPPAERVRVLARLGRLHMRLAEPDRALSFFDQALALNPKHRGSLEACVDILCAREEWGPATDRLRHLIALTPEAEQEKLLEKLGDIYFERQEDPVEAARAYAAGLETPSRRRRVLLSKLLEVYSQQKAWGRAIDAIDQMCELEDDPFKRSRHHFAAGVIAHEQMGEDQRALERLERALDDAPDSGEVLTFVERIHTAREDWAGLAAAYSRQIRRLPSEGQTPLRLKLWRGLGELCRTRLSDPDNAIAAYEVLTFLEPENVANIETLAKLSLEAGPDFYDKAITAHHTLLQRAPDQAGRYTALCQIYRETQQWDRLYCLHRALAFLGKAGSEERTFLDAHRPGVAAARGRLTPEVWQKAVMHADEDRFIGAIFSRLGAPVALLHAKPPESFGLKRRERVEPSDDRLVARTFRYACDTLDVPPPDLYLRPGGAASVQVANTTEDNLVRPALVIRGPEDPSERELLFELGARLAYTRPERYLRYALLTAVEVEAALRGMLLAMNVTPPPPGADSPESSEVERLTALIKRSVAPQALEPAVAAARKWASGRDRIDIAGWLAATDLSASRAGLLLCDDLEVAARLLSLDGAALTPLGAKERVRQLLQYAVSPEYFAVRQHLGIDVKG